MTDAPQPNLLFNWGPPRPRARALVMFIIASLLFHAFCFYVFQVVYPPAVVLLPPPARVALISNASEEGRSLLRWVDAEDPALISATLRPPNSRARELPKLQHIPSYTLERPQLKQPPPLVLDLRPPSPQPPGPVPISHRPAKVKAASAPTAVVFSEELAALGQAHIPGTKFTASAGNEQPQNVRFRIAVNGRGEVQYAFPLNSSGDAALDDEARRHVALTRFPARPDAPNESLVWGVATVEWGSDVGREHTASPPGVPPTRSP